MWVDADLARNWNKSKTMEDLSTAKSQSGFDLHMDNKINPTILQINFYNKQQLNRTKMAGFILS